MLRKRILTFRRLDAISVSDCTTADAYKWTETKEEKHCAKKCAGVRALKHLNKCMYRVKAS